MAKNLPGGSSVTRAFPASLSGGGAVDTSKWTVEYEVDFTAQGTHDFSGGATKSISSVTWTPSNNGNAALFDLHSSGLRITSNANISPWFGSFNGAPLLSAKITDMMTSLSQDDTICLQLHMDSSPDVDQDYHSYGLGLWDGTLGDATGFVLSRRVNDGGKKSGFIANTNQDLSTESNQTNFFEIVWVPADGQVLSCGVISGDFPTPLETTTQRSFNSMHGQGPGASLTWRIPYADARFAVFCYAQGNIDTLAATAYKMRVLRRKKT